MEKVITGYVAIHPLCKPTCFVSFILYYYLLQGNVKLRVATARKLRVRPKCLEELTREETAIYTSVDDTVFINGTSGLTKLYAHAKTYGIRRLSNRRVYQSLELPIWL